MKQYCLEYYDWVDREWKPCPEYPQPIPEDRIPAELIALKRKGVYKKYKVRSVLQ
jgi:hypothetical protein